MLSSLPPLTPPFSRLATLPCVLYENVLVREAVPKVGRWLRLYTKMSSSALLAQVLGGSARARGDQTRPGAEIKKNTNKKVGLE